MIRVPTLLLNARNDPFLPSEALPSPDEVSDAVTLEFPATGGHVGFVSGKCPGHIEWMPKRIMKFFATDSYENGTSMTRKTVVS